MKNAKRTPDEERRLLEVIDGEWGTIGPHFKEASAAVAEAAGCARGLCVFSASAALEVILRALNVGRGDEVVVAAWSDPADSMTCAAVGAEPVFADVDEKTLTLSPTTVGAALSANTRAVIADLPGGNPCDAEALSAFCRSHGLRFIINLSDCWGTRQNGKGIVSFADAAFADLGAGKLVDAGLAGAVLTDDEELFELFYAYHNCGRPQGDGATLSFDSIIGGDLRIAEWQSALIPGRLAGLPQALEACRTEAEKVCGKFAPIPLVNGGESSRRGTLVRADAASAEAAGMKARTVFELMSDAPLFASEYYMKATGAKPKKPRKFPVSERAAAETVLCFPE